jgi:hypothetical protein
MNQGTQGYSLTKKTEGRKSRDTVPLMYFISFRHYLWVVLSDRIRVNSVIELYGNLSQIVSTG